MIIDNYMTCKHHNNCMIWVYCNDIFHINHVLKKAVYNDLYEKKCGIILHENNYCIATT